MICPVCDRDLIEGNSINNHHLIPKLKGGKDSFPIHKICHSKIHSIWSENELRDTYNNWDSIKSDERIQKFIKWVSKKDPEFTDSNKMSKNHKKRRR